MISRGTVECLFLQVPQGQILLAHQTRNMLFGLGQNSFHYDIQSLCIKERKKLVTDRVELYNVHTLGPQEEEILHRGPFYFDAVLND